ncbi:hypothetical protein OO014_11885 [Intrasporangium calvum]|uniref:Uncharacterized protein n=1 Tax=Intrasporangium calvum TaxID=53358 RepID=A0ABT5GJ10_9MICO|nr:hypothetical protein [Intrasporangium calvum]MDC5697961.1 hypothetical protein [Intrasporangium calvum]
MARTARTVRVISPSMTEDGAADAPSSVAVADATPRRSVDDEGTVAISFEAMLDAVALHRDGR